MVRLSTGCQGRSHGNGGVAKYHVNSAYNRLVPVHDHERVTTLLQHLCCERGMGQASIERHHLPGPLLAHEEVPHARTFMLVCRHPCLGEELTVVLLHHAHEQGRCTMCSSTTDIFAIERIPVQGRVCRS